MHQKHLRSLHDVGAASIKPLPLLLKMVYTILVPLAFGKTIREFFRDRVILFVKNHELALKLTSAFALNLIAW